MPRGPLKHILLRVELEIETKIGLERIMRKKAGLHGVHKSILQHNEGEYLNCNLRCVKREFLGLQRRDELHPLQIRVH